MHKINKLLGYIIQHKKIQPLVYNNFKWNMIHKNINNYIVYLKQYNIVNQKYLKINKIHFSLK